MAQGRMISREILYDDNFLALPSSSRLLYVYLQIDADNEGIVSGKRGSMLAAEASQDDYEKLEANGFVLTIDGKPVLRHWYKVNRFSNKEMRAHAKTKELSVKAQIYLDDDNVYQVCTEKRPEHSPGIGGELEGNSRTNVIKCNERNGIKSNEVNVSQCKANSDTTTDTIPLDKIIELFNTVCRSYDRIAGLDAKDKAAIVETWKAYPDIDYFKTAFEKAERSLFLKGEKTGFKASFEWIFAPGRFSKILNGDYDDRSSISEKTKDNPDGGSFDVDEMFEAARQRGFDLLKESKADVAGCAGDCKERAGSVPCAVGTNTPCVSSSLPASDDEDDAESLPF